MNALAQLPGEEEVIVTAPPWFPDSEEIGLLERIGLFAPDDGRLLRKIWRVLKDQTDDYLEMVFGMVAAYPALAAALAVLRDEGLEDPMKDSTTIRRLFRRWLRETCLSPHEPAWLKQLYTEFPPDREAPSLLARLPNFRYLIALSFPLVATARALLVASRLGPQEIERMLSALLKAILVQVALLSKLYVRRGLW